jgi:diguanylate cyclase (GGDEF)-like protein/PAS domain S-box-containing protein
MTSPSDDFSTLFELLPIGAYRMSPEGEMLRANAALVRLNGAKDEAELRTYKNEDWYVQPTRRAEFLALLRTNGVVNSFVSEVIEQSTGVRRWISENAHMVRDTSGRVIYYEGTAEDITQSKETERTLQFVLNRFQALTAKSHNATVICDVQGTIHYANDAVRALFGVAPESMIGTNLFDTMHPEDQPEHRAEFARVAEHTNSGEESVARHLHADGTWRYLASFASDARNDESIDGMIVYWRDVTEAHLARLHLRQLAEIDSLTGVHTRANFEFRSLALLESLAAEGGRAALYFIDLDNFKLANDSYGHAVGDRVLAAIAARLRTLCPEDALLARLGGDEFAILSATPDGAMVAIEFAQRIVSAVSVPMQIDAMRFDITASVGVAVFPDHATRFTELLRFADQAMFAAKAASRNTFCVFDPNLEAQARARAALISDLRWAVDADEFTVFYQPQIDLVSNRLVGVEALVRWQHPHRGLVEPNDFIAIAEEQRLINRIGLSVINKAVAQIAQWRKVTGRALRLAINVSARQLQDRSLAAYLSELLKQHHLPAEAIEVEVTESLLIESSTAGHDPLEDLRRLGTRIVLDDLGVGYSSIAYLRRLPVDGVKLDRSFLEGLPSDAVDSAIVRSLISLARELNLTVVAEGVERVEQRDYLLAERCDVAQGYLFARPLPAAVFEAEGWLTR